MSLRDNTGNRLNLPEIVSGDGWFLVDCLAYSPQRVKLRLMELECDEDVDLLPTHVVTVDVDAHFTFCDQDEIDSFSNAVHEYMVKLRKEGFV